MSGGLGRDRAFVLPALWHRPEFRALDRAVQQLYLLLLTHPQLSLCGVVDWRPNRLAAFAADGSVEDVATAAKQLVEAGLLVVDEETEEALVRRFVRDDGLLSQPNVAKGMVRQFADVTSMPLRETFLRDLQVLRADDLRRVREEEGAVEPKGWPYVLPLLLEAAAGNPSPDPGSPQGKGSPAAGNPSPPTGNSLLRSPCSPAAAAAPGTPAPAAEPTAEPFAEPPAPAEPQQQPDAVDDLQAVLDRRGGHDVLWRLSDEERREVATLLERHGQPRLVEAAVAQGKPPRNARAWLVAWRDLRTRPTSGAATSFPECQDHPGEHAIKCPHCAATGIGMPDHVRQARAQLRRGRQQPRDHEPAPEPAPELDDGPEDQHEPVEDLADVDAGGAP